MLKKKTWLSIAAAMIVFLIYNISLFVIAGFGGHTATFWVSYGFMLVACGSVYVALFLVSNESMRLRDWLFMWPLVKHSTLYILLEFLASLIFMIFSAKIGVGIAVVVQLLFLGIYTIFSISCLSTEEIVKEIHQSTTDHIAWMRMMRVETELAAKEAPGMTAFQQLAEQFRYSDPVTNPALETLEAEIYSHVNEMYGALRMKDLDHAQALCKKASAMLTERNAKCKALKK